MTTGTGAINLNLRRLFGLHKEKRILFISHSCFIIARNEFHLIYGQYDPIFYFSISIFQMNSGARRSMPHAHTEYFIHNKRDEPSLCHHIIPLSKHQCLSCIVGIFHYFLLLVGNSTEKAFLHSTE